MVKFLRHSTSCWSNLPHKLIVCIFQLLISPSDILSFRGVCKKWRRHSFPLPPNILDTFLPHPIPTFNRYSPLVVIARSIYQLNPVSCHTHDDDNENHPSSWMVMAEEIYPGKLVLRHPLTGKLIYHSASRLDLTQFKINEVSNGYNLVHSKWRVIKVLLHSKSALFSVNDCSAVVLHDSGTIGIINLAVESSTCKSCNWDAGNSFYDDIVSFKGMVIALERLGKLVEIDLNTTPFTVKRVLAEVPVCFSVGNRRKRLLLNPFSDRLYLVLRQDLPIKCCVYVLNEQIKNWEIVKALGRNRVLFVSIDQCFFAWALDFTGCPGNSIIFTENGFTQYSEYKNVFTYRSLFHSGNAEERIRVYNLTQEDDPPFISDIPGLSEAMGSPPHWFPESTWAAAEIHENGKSQLDVNKENFQNSQETAISFAHALQLTTNQLLEVECPNCDASKLKFEGVLIRSNLVPVLQKVWARHGNIFEGSRVHSEDMFVCTLESLAKVIIILQNISGKNLAKSQCDYMNSVLLDLLQVGLKVEWLAPFVDKAVSLHQSKPLIDGLTELDTKIAKLEEMQNILKNDRVLLFEKIPVEERNYLDRCIGEGMI